MSKEIEVLGTIYSGVSDKFQGGLYPIARCVKAEKNDLSVVLKIKGDSMAVSKLGNLNGFTGGNYNGNVYDKDCESPTINTCGGGNTQPMIVEGPRQLGYIEHGTGKHQSNTVYDTNFPSPTITTIEGGGTQQIKIAEIIKVGQISNEGSQCGTVISEKGLCNTLTAGTHGYANSHIQSGYRIRKLTPRECWRLMNFSDEDFNNAEKVNSNTQLYKQSGNSIVRNVLVAIFGQLIEGKENVYKNI